MILVLTKIHEMYIGGLGRHAEGRLRDRSPVTAAIAEQLHLWNAHRGSADARRGNLGVELSRLAWAALRGRPPRDPGDLNAILTTMAFPSDAFVVD